MRIALDEARRPIAPGVTPDLPIGAIVMSPDGEVIARARNQREATGDPTAHAEVLALRQAAAVVGEWRLTGCTLVVTLEPCPMCAGAAAMARVERVVFGAWNEEYGAAGSRWDLLRDQRMAHRPEVVAGVLADECGRLVLDFMAERREGKK